MSTLNLLSGSVHIRNRKLPILWAGINAQHVAEDYINDNNNHPLLHIDIQKALQKAEIINNRGRWQGYYESPDNEKFFIPIDVYSKFVAIKTCYKLNYSTMNDAKKAKGIHGIKKPKKKDNPKVVNVTFDEETVSALERGGENVKDVEAGFIKWMNGNDKLRKKAWALQQ